MISVLSKSVVLFIAHVFLFIALVLALSLAESMSTTMEPVKSLPTG